MSVADVFTDFESVDFIKPRAFYANHTFNREWTCLYYYIHGKDSQGYDAALKLEFLIPVSASLTSESRIQ